MWLLRTEPTSAWSSTRMASSWIGPAGALLAAGVDLVMVNAGEIGARYESVYGVPFDRLERNIRTFLEIAPEPESLCIVLVDHDADAERLDAVRSYWEAVGVRLFRRLDLINRGGTLRLTHPDYATHPLAEVARRDLRPQDALCPAPVLFPFIAYDGRYLLCGSDWQRTVVLPTVFERSIHEVLEEKYDTLTKGCGVCDACNHHPYNRLADTLAAEKEGNMAAVELDELRAHLQAASAFVRYSRDEWFDEPGGNQHSTRRRRIPVRTYRQSDGGG